MNFNKYASALALGVLLSSAPAFAVPTTVSHQGRLVDAEGDPVTGTQPATFALFTAADGGEQVWEEEVSLSLSNDGTFAIELGQTSALDSSVFDGRELFLEVTIGSSALQPRLAVGSAPYAALAGAVEDGAVTTESLASGVLDWGNIGNIPAGVDGLGALSCTDGQIAQFAGGAWACADASNTQDTTLTEAEVDAFVANNGYLTTEAEVDAFVANNGYVSTVCTAANEIPIWDGSAWGCQAFDVSSFLTSPAADADIEDTISVSNTALHAPAGATQVGINTTTTTAELTVAGDVHFANGNRFIGMQPGVNTSGGITIQAGGRIASSGAASGGGTVTIAAGNNNISAPTTSCSTNTAGGNVVLRAGSNTFGGICGDARTGHIIFQAGDADSGTSPERMRIIGDNGRVGIGTSTPGFRLQVAGSVAGVGAYTNTSDSRLKEDVQKVDGALNMVKQMEGVHFKWKDDYLAETSDLKKQDIGFLAQDLQKVLPTAVEQGEDGYYRVAYSKVTPVLVEAVKEQQSEIDTLKKQNAEMEARLKKLENSSMAKHFAPISLVLGMAFIGLALVRRRRD